MKQYKTSLSLAMALCSIAILESMDGHTFQMVCFHRPSNLLGLSHSFASICNSYFKLRNVLLLVILIVDSAKHSILII
jgi:hypothetical protein